MSNEHTEQSERAGLIERLQSAPADMLGTELEQLYSDCHKAAALLAADKAGGEAEYRKDMPVSGSVLGEQIDKAKEDQRLFGVGFTVNGWHVPAQLVASWGMEKIHPHPSALPDDVVKDAERWRKASTSRNHGIVDWTEFGQRTVYGELAVQVIDAAMLKEGK